MAKNMRILFFIFLGFVISCQSKPVQNRSAANVISAQNKTGRHFIITVHGFRGAQGTFGQMEKVLIPHLKKLHPQTDYQYLEFSYPSGTDKDVFKFSYNYLSRFLHENIKNPTMNDSLIFVAHSQGGIVVNVWKAAAQYGLVYSQDQNGTKLEDRVYAQITDQVITLGTPFWGSNQAKLALNLNILKAGYDQELNGLVFNSDLILWMRNLAIMMEGQTEDDPTRYSNIAGILPNDRNKIFYSKELIRGGVNQAGADVVHTLFKDLARRHSFSSERISSRRPDRFETDLTVLVPSTRSSFYNVDRKVRCDDVNVDAEDFKEVSLFKPAQYILTEGVHTSALSKRTRGIADVPLFCIEPSKCSHPTYRYLLNLIAHCENGNCQPQAKVEIIDKLFAVNKIDTEYNKILTAGVDLQGFSLDLNIQVPADYDLPEKFYSDRPYTQTESVESDAEGNEIYVTRRKTKLLTERDMRDRKLIRDILKLDSSKLGTDLKDMVEIRMVRRRESFSGLTCWGKATNCPNANELRLHVTGWIKPKSLEVIKKYQTTLIEKYRDGMVLPFVVQLPETKNHKFKKTTMMTKVRPGYSTFVRLNYLDAINCRDGFPMPLIQQ
jgi:Putative serine esterase (DUF676)